MRGRWLPSRVEIQSIGAGEARRHRRDRRGTAVERWLTEFVKLWVVIDPIGTLPVFLAVTAGLSAAAARRIALQLSLIHI